MASLCNSSLSPNPSSLRNGWDSCGRVNAFRRSSELSLFGWRNFEIQKLSRGRDIVMEAVVDGATEYLDDSLRPRIDLEEKEPSVSTILTNFACSFDPYDAVSTPLYQTATFKQPSAVENGPYDYTRSGNPTRDTLESLLAKLDKADRAFCFTSGMAALAAVTHLVETGQEIVTGTDMYGGSDRLLSRVIPKRGIVVRRIDTTDLDDVASAIGPKTKIVWLESPTNPRQQISDIRASFCLNSLVNK